MKACIFDLDGTLTDTLESLAYSVKASLKELGLPEITTDQCRQFIGNGARRLMECALLAAGDVQLLQIEEGMKVYGRIFDANCTYHVTPYDGITQTLKCLKEKEIKLAVLSNKPHAQTVKVVKEIFGAELFNRVQGQKEGIGRKPDPEGVSILLNEMQVEPEECLYIGDSEVDVQTALNAGVKCIAVSWGFRSRDILADAGAEHIIDVPEELLQYV